MIGREWMLGAGAVLRNFVRSNLLWITPRGLGQRTGGVDVSSGVKVPAINYALT